MRSLCNFANFGNNNITNKVQQIHAEILEDIDLSQTKYLILCLVQVSINLNWMIK